MAVADAKDRYYRKLRDTQFSFDEISQGVLAMYVIHAILTTGEDQISGMVHAIEALITDAKCGTPGPLYCC